MCFAPDNLVRGIFNAYDMKARKVLYSWITLFILSVTLIPICIGLAIILLPPLALIGHYIEKNDKRLIRELKMEDTSDEFK